MFNVKPSGGPGGRLDQISAGFMEAKILFAAAELRLFDALRGQGATAAEAARRTGASVRGATILLDALAAMEIVAKEGGVYRNRPEHEADLLEDGATHFVAMLRHRNQLFRRWGLLEDIVTGKVPVEGHAHRPSLSEKEANDNFIRAMYAITKEIAPVLVDRFDLRGVEAAADLGGGPGVYLQEMARRLPEAQLLLVDLPITLEVARRILAGSPYKDRVKLVPWDIYGTPPPEGLPPLDFVLLSQVVHGEGPKENQALFRKVFGIMRPGGRLVVHERILGPDRTSPRDAALFAVNMLAMTEAGNVYTEEEIHGWGRAAGFLPEPGSRINDRSYLVTLRRP